MAEILAIDDLEAALHRLGKAWSAGDAAELATMTAVDYTHVDPAGAFFGRESWLAYVRGRAGRRTTIVYRDLAFRRHGDVAVVTGVSVFGGGGVRSSDDPRELTIRFTQVWIRKGGRWLREAFQGTPIGDERYS